MVGRKINGVAAERREGCFLEITLTLRNNLNLNPVDDNLETCLTAGQPQFKENLSCSQFMRTLVSMALRYIPIIFRHY
jgi:hypothetical protein